MDVSSIKDKTYSSKSSTNTLHGMWYNSVIICGDGKTPVEHGQTDKTQKDPKQLR